MLLINYLWYVHTVLKFFRWTYSQLEVNEASSVKLYVGRKKIKEKEMDINGYETWWNVEESSI